MPSGGFGYGGAYGWQAVGAGLRRIGQVLAGKQQEDRKRLEANQDRDLALARLRAQDLAEPGASTLPAYLDNPVNFGPGGTADAGPLTAESLRRVANAEDTGVPIELKPKTATTVDVPAEPGTGQPSVTLDLPSARPYVMPSGVVQDPQEANRLRQIGLVADQRLKQRMVLPPWQREGFGSEADYHAFQRRGAAAEATGRDLTDKGKPRPTVNQAMEILRDRYAVVRPDSITGRPSLKGYGIEWEDGTVTPVREEDMYAEALDMAAGKPMRPTPPAPLPRAAPIQAMPPAKAGFFTRLGRALVPGGRGWSDTTPAGTPMPPEPPRPAAPTVVAPRDTTGFGAAQKRAQELQAQGKTDEQILRIMRSEGYSVR